MIVTPTKRERLHPWLVKAYWASSTPREFAAVRLLWMLCGFHDPLHGEPELQDAR